MLRHLLAVHLEYAGAAATDGRYFGPDALAGKQSNWVPTDPKGKFELMFRLYAPTKALFEKAWTLPDVEKVD